MYPVILTCTHVMHCQQIGTHMMNCRTDVLKGFDSKTEAIGLTCLCGNAEGINDLVLQGQTLVRIRALSLALWALYYKQ